MAKRLGDEDRRAVDLLLDSATGNGDGLPVERLFAMPVRESFEHRLEAAEKLLSLLNEMPDMEPPANLVRRTLQRIEEATLEPTVDAASRPRPLLGGQAHA